MRQQRSIGCGDDYDRTKFSRSRIGGPKMCSNRNAADYQLAGPAAIELHNHAERVTALIAWQPARRSADSALPSIADHPGAAPDVAFRNRSPSRSVQGRECVSGLDVKAVGIVQVAVPRLRDDRQRPRLKHPAV